MHLSPLSSRAYTILSHQEASPRLICSPFVEETVGAIANITGTAVDTAFPILTRCNVTFNIIRDCLPVDAELRKFRRFLRSTLKLNSSTLREISETADGHVEILFLLPVGLPTLLNYKTFLAYFFLKTAKYFRDLQSQGYNRRVEKEDYQFTPVSPGHYFTPESYSSDSSFSSSSDEFQGYSTPVVNPTTPPPSYHIVVPDDDQEMYHFTSPAFSPQSPNFYPHSLTYLPQNEEADEPYVPTSPAFCPGSPF